MSRTLKSKSILTAFLAVVMAACLALGITFTTREVKADEATTTTQWESSGGGDPNNLVPLVEVGQTGIQANTTSATIINNQNILEVKGRKVSFQFATKGQSGWAAFVLLNGKTNWTAVNWPGLNSGSDVFPHIIIQSGGAQIYGASTPLFYNGANGLGVVGTPVLDDQLHTVEIYIGTNDTDDVSTLSIDGTQLVQETKEGVEGGGSSVLKWATADAFTNGCYFAFTGNLTPGGTTLFGEYNAPYVDYTSISDEFKSKIRVNPTVAPDGLTFTVKNITGTPSLVLNTTADGATYKNVTVDSDLYTVADADGGKKYTLKQSFWTTYFKDLSSLSSLSVVAENGKAAISAPVQKTNPPTVTKDYVAIDGDIDDVSFTFEYEVTGLTDGTLRAGREQLSGDALVSGTDYTLTSDGSNYTVTVKKAYLESQLGGGYNGLRFSFNIDDNNMEFYVYRSVDAEGWYAKATDLAEGEEMRTEGFYNVATLRKFNAGTLSTRVYYNYAFDVTKPITFEFENFTNVNSTGTEWGMLGVMDNLTVSEYFSNDNCNDTLKLGALFFGSRKDIQKFNGIKFPTDISNADYNALFEVKNNVVEIMFGDGKNVEGYLKINGKVIGTTTALQSDFRNGKAYIGFFIADQRRASFEFKANKNVNSIAVTGPNDNISYYTIDIANPANDLVLDVINTDGTNLKITNEKGLVAAADDFSYADGKLTVKKSYFKKFEFAKSGSITIEDTAKNTGTTINLVYESSAMKAPVMAFATKGALTDAEFTLSGVTGVTKVFAGDVELTADKYSFANGKLTINKSALKDAVGVNEFIVISSTNELYPAYVIVNEFKDGFAKTGAGTVETSDGAYALKGANGVTYMNAYDLTKGYTLKVDFKSTVGYYQSGNNRSKKGYIKLNFYDPYSGETFFYTLYTNFDKDSVTATDTALYHEYGYASDAMSVRKTALNISTSENANALGVHNVKIAVESGRINITVDNSRTVKLDLAAQFNANALVLTVETPASADKEMSVAIKEYAQDATVDYNEISIGGNGGDNSGDSGSSGDDANNTDKKGCAGCGGSVAGAGIVGLTLITLCGVSLLKRKKND